MLGVLSGLRSVMPNLSAAAGYFFRRAEYSSKNCLNSAGTSTLFDWPTLAIVTETGRQARRQPLDHSASSSFEETPLDRASARSLLNGLFGLGRAYKKLPPHHDFAELAANIERLADYLMDRSFGLRWPATGFGGRGGPRCLSLRSCRVPLLLGKYGPANEVDTSLSALVPFFAELRAGAATVGLLLRHATLQVHTRRTPICVTLFAPPIPNSCRTVPASVRPAPPRRNGDASNWND